MHKRRLSGFTLLELAIVIIVISLVAGMGLRATIGMVESAKLSATLNKLDVIENALMQFRSNFNRLPCPGDVSLARTDSSYGVEASGAGNCLSGSPAATFYTAAAGTPSVSSVVEGAVPFKALNLPEQFMYDGWGRRFAYAADVNMTATDAFNTIKPNEYCRITVTDGGGNRTGASFTSGQGAVYVLLSYGANGHGGYINGSSGRFNAGSISTYDHSNCHCDSSAANSSYTASYIQRDYTENLTGDSKYDDHVRFKERWQMMTPADAYDYTGYQGAQLAIGYGLASAGTNVSLHSNQCNRWYQYYGNASSAITGTGAASTTIQTVTGLKFTPNNQHLFIYSDNATNCRLLKFANTGTTAATIYVDQGGSAVPSCPSHNANNKVEMTSNGNLAITFTSSPYVRLWKLNGDVFVLNPNDTGVSANNKLFVNFPPTAAPTVIALSRNADYMFLSDGSTYSSIYRRQPSGKYLPALVLTVSTVGTPNYSSAPTVSFSGGSGSGLKAKASVSGGAITSIRIYDQGTGYTSAPTVSLTGGGCSTCSTVSSAYTLAGVPSSPTAAAFSPDDRYLAVANSSTVQLWTVDTNTDTFTTLSTLSVSNVGIMKFSQDGKYLALGKTTNTATVAGNIVMYKVDAANTFTALTMPTNSYSDAATNRPLDIDFSPDSKYFFATNNGSGGPLTVLRQTSATTYVLDNGLVTGTALSTKGNRVAAYWKTN